MQKIVYFLILCFPLAIFAQKSKSSYSLESPKETVKTHSKFLENDNYFPSISAKTLNNEDELSAQEIRDRAMKLKHIFNGLGIHLNYGNIPNNPNYADSAQGKKNIYVLKNTESDIFLEKIGNKWLYSAHTVEKIPEIFSRTYPFGTDKLLEMTQDFNIDLIGYLYLWQYVGIGFTLIFSLIIYKIFRFLALKKPFFKTLVKYGHEQLANKFIEPAAKPFSFLITFAILTLAFRVLQIPAFISQYILLVFNVLMSFFLVQICYYLVDALAFYSQRAAEKSDNQLIPLLKNILKIVVVIFGSLFILQKAGMDITSLVAGISIGGLALALAAQDMIKNLFGSLMIFVDKPFQVGDWIVADKIDGTVEEIGFRSTRIRTFYDSVTAIPNGKMADLTIDNMGLRVFRRYQTRICIAGNVPPDVVELFVLGLKKIVENHPKTRKDNMQISLEDILPSGSRNILFYIFFEVPSWTEEMDFRQEILLEILRLAQQLGISFGIPSSVVHVETFPEKIAIRPIFQGTKAENLKKMEDFLAGRIKT